MPEKNAPNGADTNTPDEANETPLTLSALQEALAAQDEKWQQRFNAQDAAFKKRLKKFETPTQVPQKPDDDDATSDAESDPRADALQKQIDDLKKAQRDSQLDDLFRQAVAATKGLTPNAGKILEAMLRPSMTEDGKFDFDGEEVGALEAIKRTVAENTELKLPDSVVQSSSRQPTTPGNSNRTPSPNANKGDAKPFDPKNGLGMIGDYFVDQAKSAQDAEGGTVI